MFDTESPHTQLFTNATGAGFPFEFATKSYWIDRLHHYFIFTFTQITDVRFHKAYGWSSRGNSTSISDPRQICAHESAPLNTTPLFCRDTIRWMCSHPTNSSDDEMLPIWDHIAVRFDDLQQRYQEFELDFTMFVSTTADQSQSHVRGLPSVTILTDALEITTLIRGRQCDCRGCRTVFIDDYRYERGVIESDEDNRALYVTILRGLAQLYVWLRVVLLAWGCYGRSREPMYRNRSVFIKLAVAGRTMLKVPSHVIVYGSCLPIVAYSGAHFYDSGLVQSLGEFEWSSLNGFFKFNVVDYVLAASIHMRNIWMIVLVWILVFTFLSRPANGQSISSHLTHHGVLTVRSGWIGLISWLTTFSMMRALHFQDTNVLEILPLPRHTGATTLYTQRNLNDYGFQFDVKCCLASLLLVGGFGSLFHTLVHHTADQDTSVFFCRSFYVPYSAGTLWSWSTLDMFWSVQFDSDSAGPRMKVIPGAVLPPSSSPRRPVTSPASIVSVDSVSPPRISDCRLCNFKSSMTHWPATQGCPHHEPIFDVHRRTKALWSMVKLMNIANTTDPIALFRLYVTGRQLYLYRVTSPTQPAYSILLPTAMERNDVAKKTRKLTIRWSITIAKRGPTTARSLSCCGS